MRKITYTLIGLLLGCFTMLPFAAEAETPQSCVIDALGVRVCGSLVDAPAPVMITVAPPTVTLPPLPPVTIRVPGPTVRLPGPTVTVTQPVPAPPRIPRATVTVTARPNAPRPSALPTQTVTVTASPVPQSGQTPSGRATLSPAPENPDNNTVETRTKTETIVRGVAVGTLVLLLLAGLGMLALFLGYALGQKDAQRNEDRFLESLIGVVRGERR